MKHLKLFTTLCCVVLLFAACGSTTTGTENGHEWVDLGLLSGTKWATCNVGAANPEEYGNYYAWGETETKTTYKWSTYKWYIKSSSTFTKYNTSSPYCTRDNKTVLDLADDAAHVNWGGKWRMPTDAEWTELRENCEWTWIFLNGHMGYQVKGTNGKSIFLPAAGFRNYDGLNSAGDYGVYWSSSLNTGSRDAWFVSFDSDYVGRDGKLLRYHGLSVRPVLFVREAEKKARQAEQEKKAALERAQQAEKQLKAEQERKAAEAKKQNGTHAGHEYVDLGLSVKWATCNVGATKPEAYGNYYAWGETATKETYDWSNYFDTSDGGSTFTKYTIDGKTVLDLEDDAAAVNWGDQWRMPTDAEWTELRKNCTWTWTDDYNGTGVAGRIVTSKTNGNSIFLPAAGFRSYDGLYDAGDYGDYWSSSLNTGSRDAWNVYFNSGYVYRDRSSRCCGQSVRPVLYMP